jgi:hypothetical protein
MKKLLLLTLTAFTVLPALAEAGPLTDKAYQVAAQLGSRESSLSSSQQAQVARDLDHLMSVLNGTPTPDRSYLCVSRDNDNNRPYVLAYKDFANVVRIQSAAYNSMEECQQALANGQRINENLFVCATRDNDGSNPWKMVAINGGSGSVMLQRSVLNTLADCITASRAMQVRPEGVLYCGSRDNDGGRPFAQTGYKLDGTFVQGRDEYETLGDCNANL